MCVQSQHPFGLKDACHEVKRLNKVISVAKPATVGEEKKAEQTGREGRRAVDSGKTKVTGELLVFQGKEGGRGREGGRGVKRDRVSWRNQRR